MLGDTFDLDTGTLERLKLQKSFDQETGLWLIARCETLLREVQEIKTLVVDAGEEAHADGYEEGYLAGYDVGYDDGRLGERRDPSS